MSEALTKQQILQKQAEELLANAMKSRFQRFDPESLAWLVLPPAWTETVARTCDFPTGTLNLDAFLDEARAAGLCERGQFVFHDGQTDRSFWISDAFRSQVLQQLRRDSGPRFLEKQTYVIGSRISDQNRQRGVPVPDVLARWAELAAQTKGGISGATQWLNHQVRRLVADEETGQALAWLETGETLARTLGGDLEAAVLLGNRRLELAYRRVMESRHLDSFLERPDLLVPFHEMLKPESADNAWALHYVGMGGVGKTMLLRYITAREAPELQIATCRIDFDYLSPDFPVRKPGQLLMELAEELRSYVPNARAEDAFTEFEYEVIDLHEALGDEPPPHDPLANIRRPEFTRTLRAFIAALAPLPKPIVLILDTCEELTKLPPTGEVLANVEATFEILERIHKQVPEVRVVFAGRRLLARSGRGWQAVGPSLVAGKKDLLPEQKPYLRLYEIRGFSDQAPNGNGRSDVDRFFQEKKGLQLTADMRQAVLERSPEIGRAAEVKYDPPRTKPLGTLYSPFDLDLYAKWLLDEPDLDARTIASGATDPYVERRIVKRIKAPYVRAALPAAVSLRRFDKTMLRLYFLRAGSAQAAELLARLDPAVLDLPLTLLEEEFDQIYRELGDQEWIDYQPDRDLDTTFLEIDRQLQPRLIAYFAQPGRGSESAKGQLGPLLDVLVRSRALAELSVSHLDAALRLLPVEQAAALWAQVDRRVAEEGRWNWAIQVTNFILSDRGAVPGRDHPLRAAVGATRVSATLHVAPAVDVTAAWEEVSQTAVNHPDPTIGAWLTDRALLGQMTASLAIGRVSAAIQLARIWPLIRRHAKELADFGADLSPERRHLLAQLTASTVAALDGWLESADLNADWAGIIGQIAEALAVVLESVELPPDIEAYAWLLLGRFAWLAGKADPAQRWLARAEIMLPADEALGQRWADWRMPASLPDRIRLEILRLPSSTTGVTAEQYMRWQQAAEERLDTIDGERLVSRILQLRLRNGLVPVEELEHLASLDKYNPNDLRLPECRVHRQTPPLVATLAQALTALGHADLAMDWLNDRTDQATRTGRDQATVRELERTKLKVIRRARMADRGLTLSSSLARSVDPTDAALAWRRIALTLPPNAQDIPTPSVDSSVALRHAWWSSWAALASGSEYSQLLPLLISLPPADEIEEDYYQYAWALDKREMAHLYELTSEDAVPLTLDIDEYADAGRFWEEHPEDSERALRLLLRQAALANTPFPDEWAADFGHRGVAQLALDEGELLALRLPEKADLLLQLAQDAFEQVGDLFGTVQAAALRAIGTTRVYGAEKAQRESEASLAATYDRLVEDGPLSLLPNRQTVTNDLSGDIGRTTLQHRAVGGWLERVFIRLDWGADSDAKGDKDTPLRLWLMGQHEGGLPAELDLTLSLENLKEAQQDADSSNVDFGLGDWLGIIVALLIFIGLLVGGYFLVGWLIGSVTTGGVGGGMQFGIYVAILLALGFSPRGFRKAASAIRSWQAANSRVTLAVESEQSSVGRRLELDRSVPVRFDLQQRRRQFLALPPFSWRHLRLSRWPGQTPGIQPYAVGAEAFAEEGVAALQAIREALGDRQLPVLLLVDQAAAAYPWEAVLQLALMAAETEERPAGRLQFWRDTTRDALSQQSASPGDRTDNRYYLSEQQVLTGFGTGTSARPR